MKNYSDRLFALNGHIVGEIQLGSNTIRIGTGNRHVFGTLNNRRITDSKSSKEFLSKAVPVISMIAVDLYPEEKISVGIKESSDLLDNILDQIRKNKNDIEIEVFKYKPDEITQNKPRIIRASNDSQMIKKTNYYINKLNNISENIKESVKLGEILLRSKLPKTMWGEKEIRKVLSSISSDLNSMKKDKLNMLDSNIEHSDRSARYLVLGLRNFCDDTKSIVSKEAGTMINNFFKLKDMISNLSQIFYDLFNIDPLFKKFTGYPTTWFFNSSIYYDFLYSFENLIKDLITATKIESEIIEPLFVWKVKVTGDNKCQTI